MAHLIFLICVLVTYAGVCRADRTLSLNCRHGSQPSMLSSCSSTSCAGFKICVDGLYREQTLKAVGFANGPIRIQPAMFFATAQALVSAPAASLLVEADVPPGMNIQITDASINVDTHKISGASFTIKNTNSKILLAYSVAFEIYFADKPAPVQLRVTEDGSFLYHYLLRPGESKQGLVRTTLTTFKEQLRLSKVVAVPDYVEFADGSAYGSNNEVIGADLKASRKVKIDLLKKYAGQLKTGIRTDEQNNGGSTAVSGRTAATS
jgi:hypothetical protein